MFLSAKFSNVGQNIAMTMVAGTNANYQKPKDIADGLVANWYSEFKYAQMSDIRKLTRIYVDAAQTKAIGHFTQMVYDRVIRIGCAMSQFKQDNANNPDQPWLSNLLVCNYAGSQFSNFPVYKDGKAASSCKKTNPDYPNLCDVSQEVSINPFTNDY